MLRSIHVDGFKSLINCSVVLRPGVNILIGAQGAGKSNILMFMAFLSAMFTRPAVEAVYEFGGVGRIFSRTAMHGLGRKISVRLAGGGIYRARFGAKNSLYAEYDYEFTIAYSEDIETVFFENQNLKFFQTSNEEEVVHRESSGNFDVWDVHVEQSAHVDGFRIVNQCKTLKFNSKKVDQKFAGINPRYFLADSDDSEKVFADRFNKFGNCSFPIVEDLGNVFPSARYFITDFSRSKILNIDPKVVKNGEDCATSPGIEEDGEGVAATLHALGRAKLSPNSEKQSMPRIEWNENYSTGIRDPKIVLEMIQNSVKFACEEIESIQPVKDQYTNKIQVHADLKSNNGIVNLPISLLSDGTAKWLALITSVLTNRSILAIEYPENFIQTCMQSELLNIIRDCISNADEDSSNNFMFLTTHSETMLNSADPSEIIIVSMENGSTRTRRIKRIEDVRNVIQGDGFGLGHMYRCGKLEDF